MANALSRNFKNSEDKEEDKISLPILAVIYVTIKYQQYPKKTHYSPNQERNFQRCHITIADKIHQICLAYGSKETSKGITPLLEW